MLQRDAVSFAELLAHTQQESQRWQEWFNVHPEALELKIDIAHSKAARDLLYHIFFVDRRFAEWLAGDSLTAPENIADFTCANLFAVENTAIAKFRFLLEKSELAAWDHMIIFPKPMEGLQASRRKCFLHAIVHGIRHWAQLATALRVAGYSQDWQHDFLLSPAME